MSGIRSAGSGDFQIILKDLRKSGYKLTTNLYKAERYGIPQTRHRVIIVGIREDLDAEFHVPDPSQYASVDISARTALSNIPPNASNNEIRPLQQKVVRRLSLIQPGENVWQAEERLGDQFPEDLKIKTKTKISQIYRKLDPDKPAYTVTAADGGGTFMYHWTDRGLTNRERARIQTFPDDFEFVGKYSSVRKQIDRQIQSEVEKSGVHGSGITVSNFIRMIENQSNGNIVYSHKDLRRIFGIDRQVRLEDISGHSTYSIKPKSSVGMVAESRSKYGKKNG